MSKEISADWETPASSHASLNSATRALFIFFDDYASSQTTVIAHLQLLKFNALVWLF